MKYVALLYVICLLYADIVELQLLGFFIYILMKLSEQYNGK